MKKDKYALGLVSVSFRQHSPKEILEVTKAAGLSCIEWGSDVHAPCHDIERLHKIAEMQKEYGIFCSSYGTYFRLGETPIEELSDYIAAAKALGTDILRLWGTRKSGKDMTEEERKDLLELCRTVAKIAEDSGVTFCLECHKNTFTENPDDAVWLMQSIRSPRFRMYWQPFQWRTAEENETYAKAIAPYVRHVHVFQWKRDDKFSLREGIEEWQRYLACLPDHGALLLEFMPNGGLNELTAEADALREIIGGNV